MPLEKNYAILEIQKILLDAREVAEQHDHIEEEAKFLAITKEIYPQLEQVFRLVFEPTFNESERLELEHLRKENKRLSGLVMDHAETEENLLNANNNLLVNAKEHIEIYKEEIAWLRKVVGSAVSLNYSIGGKSNG